jgi:hypothetical protein
LDELFPLIRKSKKLSPLYARIYGGMGNEYIRWLNGSLIRLLSTSSSSGHSKTLHQAVLDEVWHDMDARREQGLRPAMITVQDAQLLVCSTAGTADSVVLNRKVQVGREAVLKDAGTGIAYLEYSAPDGWDPMDEESYYGFMPALCSDPPCQCGRDDGGWRHTVTLDTLRGERLSMEPPEFARAYGNIPTPGLLEQPIGSAQFAALTVLRRRPRNVSPVFFPDVSPGMGSASIGVAYQAKDGPVAELANFHSGTSWLVDRCVELAKKFPQATWAVEGSGAIGALVPQLVEAGIEPESYTGGDMGRACAHLQKLVTEQAFTHDGAVPVAEALLGAVKRDVGEGLWAWGRRKSTTDLSPLVAVTGALWTLELHGAYELLSSVY